MIQSRQPYVVSRGFRAKGRSFDLFSGGLHFDDLHRVLDRFVIVVSQAMIGLRLL